MKILGGGGCGFRGIRIRPAHLPSLVMMPLARKGETRDPFLQGVRLNFLTTGIGGDANTTRLSPAMDLLFTVRIY